MKQMVFIGVVVAILVISVGLGAIYLPGILVKSSSSPSIPLISTQSNSSYSSSTAPVTIYVNQSVASNSQSSSTHNSTLSVTSGQYPTVTETVTVTEVLGNGTCIVTPPPPSPPQTPGIQTGDGPYDAAFDNYTNDLFVSNAFDNTVSVLDLSTNSSIATIPVGQDPSGVAFDPQSNEIFVSDYSSNSTTIINASSLKVITTLLVNTLPSVVLYVPSNGYVYVSNTASPEGNLVGGSLTVINGLTNKLVGTIEVGGGAWGLAFDPSTNQIFEANHANVGTPGDNVSVIDASTDKVIHSILIGGDQTSLFGAGYNPYNNEVYVANWNSNTVYAISASNYTLVDNITVGGTPVGMAYDPLNHSMYVVNDGDGTVSVVAANNTVVNTYSVGPGPKWAAFVPSTGDVYVTNTADSSVSVVP